MPGATAVLRIDIWLDAVGISEVDDLADKVIDLMINDKLLIISVLNRKGKNRNLKIGKDILDDKIDILIDDDKLLTVKFIVLNGEDIVLVTPVAGKRVREEKGECHVISKSNFDFLHRRRAGVDQGHSRDAWANTAPRHPL